MDDKPAKGEEAAEPPSAMSSLENIAEAMTEHQRQLDAIGRMADEVTQGLMLPRRLPEDLKALEAQLRTTGAHRLQMEPHLGVLGDLAKWERQAIEAMRGPSVSFIRDLLVQHIELPPVRNLGFPFADALVHSSFANVDALAGLRKAHLWSAESPAHANALFEATVRQWAPKLGLTELDGLDGVLAEELSAALAQVPPPSDAPIAAQAVDAEVAGIRVLGYVWNRILERYPNISAHARRALWVLLVWLVTSVGEELIGELVARAGNEEPITEASRDRQATEQMQQYLAVMMAAAPPARYSTTQAKHVYDEPNPRATRIGIIPSDIVLIVGDRQEQWLYVTWEDQDSNKREGWTYKRYLRPIPNAVSWEIPGRRAPDPSSP